MKKLLLSVSLFSTLFASAQITIFEDSFETYTTFAIGNVGSWTLLDIDQSPSYGFTAPTTFENAGDPFAFIVFDASATTPAPLTASATSNWTARTGSKAMVSFAAVMPADGGQGPNNDWLISPQITLGSTGNSLTFWAKTTTPQYGLERFTVSVSTTGTAPANFTKISAGNYISAPGITFAQYTYNLDAYAGQNVYIGINCITPDSFGFVVDDFKVTATALSVDDKLAGKFSVSPNPASDFVIITNNENIALNQVKITDLNGRTVKQIALSGVNNPEINVSDLSAGVYMLNISSDQGSVTKKIVKN